MENNIKKKKCEILAEEIAKMECGDTITHTQIASIIGERHGTPKYGQIVAKVKKILLEEYRIYLESVHAVGYKKSIPDDFTKHAITHIKRGFNQVQKGADTLTYAPVEDMSEEGRNTYRYIYDRTKQLEAGLKGSVVEIKMLREKRRQFLPENVGRR